MWQWKSVHGAEMCPHLKSRSPTVSNWLQWKGLLWQWGERFLIIYHANGIRYDCGACYCPCLMQMVLDAVPSLHL